MKYSNFLLVIRLKANILIGFVADNSPRDFPYKKGMSGLYSFNFLTLFAVMLSAVFGGLDNFL